MSPLFLRLALRELRSGLRGFHIFLACLALGVAAIAAAGSTAEAFRRGLASQSAEILGGDLAVSVQQRPFSTSEREAFSELGRWAQIASVRAMAEGLDGERRLVELRGVSDAYPLAGAVRLQGRETLSEVLEVRSGAPGAAVEQDVLDRLGLKLGDRFRVGQVMLEARAVLLEEPDRLSRGFALGPRVLTTLDTLESAGLVERGLPFTMTATLVLDPPQDLKAARRTLAAKVSGAERIRDRLDAAPGAGRLIDQLEYFLGFIGLASLLAGGLGVHSAVSAFLERRQPSIAILKSLGAEGALIRNIYLTQIAALAALGLLIGLGLGAAAPFVLGALLPADLPVPALFSVYPGPLARAAGFGALAAAAFSLAPLARARATSPASLFRRTPSRLGLVSPEAAGAALAGLGLCALAVATAPTQLAAVVMIGAVVAGFGLLWVLGLGAVELAGRLRAATRGSLRLALANLAGPRSAARSATPAIGLGVALLACVVLIQSSLLRQVDEIAPSAAPAVVFTEIPGARAVEFEKTVASAFGRPLGREDWLLAPFFTGRIIAVNGAPVDRSAIEPRERWAYDNDIAMTAIGAEPPNANVVEGSWWAAGTTQPLAAMDVDAARAAGLKPGDTLTLDILGREMDIELAVLRDVEFGSFGPSFGIVVSPPTIRGAGLNAFAIARATREEEARAARALGASFAEVNVISVRDQLEAATQLFDRLALAVRAAAGVAALAGLFVLAGAIAAGAQTRAREAAVLKVLGASRRQILTAYVIEYGAVGLIAGSIGAALGAAAAWPVIALVFRSDWWVDWGGVGALVGCVAAVTGIGGMAAAFGALRRRPAATLRSA